MLDFKSQSLTDTETAPGQQSVQHLLLSIGLLDDGTHRLCIESWLMLISYNGHIDEAVIPLSRKQLFSVIIDCRGHNQLCQSNIIANRFGRKTRLMHRRNQTLYGQVVDCCEREVAKIRVEPFIDSVLPRR